MKTYQQFSEDIEKRRKQLRQRQLDQMAKFKEKSRSAIEAQRQKREHEQERESLKREIKRELKNEKE